MINFGSGEGERVEGGFGKSLRRMEVSKNSIGRLEL
jgi:hypothetical protein